MRTTLAGLPRSARVLQLVAVTLLAAAGACGKGGSAAAPLPPSSQYAARCVTPRTGIDPQTGAAYTDRAGTLADEMAWIRSWIDELYLWYREVPSLDPAPYPTPVAYFNVLKTSARTASGALKDKFHFIYPTADWVALSQFSVEAGYGAQWVLIQAYPPRQVVAAYVEAGSPAAAANIIRGTEVLEVDGVAVLDSPDTATLNEGLFPTVLNATHQLTISDPVGGTRTVPVTSASITSSPVPTVRTLTTPTGPVGYLLFNDHTAPAEAQLMAAVEQLKTAAVTDLVLDLRYNGGGYLDIAAEAAYMIAGPAATTGKTFERLVFNDKAGSIDPVTGALNQPVLFWNTASGYFSAPAGTSLPYLGLPRVFVLTGSGTCSASESIINSLRGVGVSVIQVGATTCGKPYGFYPADNCGTTYFAIQFQGVNQLGFGDYGDGFVPGGPGTSGVPGCVVADDFGHALGDPAEARLAMALGYRATATCTPAASLVALRTQRSFLGEGELVKSPWRENRILTR